jgi:hypothetical protein
MAPDAETPAGTYYQSQWCGHPHYTCLACGTSTLNYPKLVAHLRGRHGLAPLQARTAEATVPPGSLRQSASSADAGENVPWEATVDAGQDDDPVEGDAPDTEEER